MVTPIDGAVDATAALLERLDHDAMVAEASLPVLAERIRRTANLYALYYEDAEGNFTLVLRPEASAAIAGPGSAFEARIIRRPARSQFEQRGYRLDSPDRVLAMDGRYHKDTTRDCATGTGLPWSRIV